MTQMVASLILGLWWCGFIGEAQAQNSSKVGHEYSVLAGALLPNAVPDFYPVTTLYGGSYGFYAYDYRWEVGLLLSQVSERSYYNSFLTLKGEAPFSEFFCSYGFGLDLTYHKGDTGQTFTTPGFHLEGGLLLPVYSSLWVKPEVRMGFNPGNTVFIGLAFVYRDSESPKAAK